MAERAFTPRTVTEAGDLGLLAQHFLERIAARGRSPLTLKAYQTDLEQFAGFLKARDISQVQTIGRHNVEDWLDALLTGEGVSTRTAARKLETVRSFFRYVEERGLVTELNSPMKGVEAPRFEARRVIAPPKESIERFLREIPTDTPIGLRDRALFMLMYDAALRVDGVLCLDLYDAAEPPAWCVQPDGVIHYRYKGGVTRETFCEAPVLKAIQAYLAVRHTFFQAAHSKALFTGNRQPRLTRQAIHARIKLHGKASGLPKLHCHLLRHRRAGEVIEKVGMREASYLLGHASESVTGNVYGHAHQEKVRARIRAGAPAGLPELEEAA